MALIPCRECQREISTEAVACPHCGAPTPGEPSSKATCRECAAPLAPDAIVCAHCGAQTSVAPVTIPPKKSHAHLWGLLMILGALFAVSYVVGAITEYRKTPEQKAADQEHRRAADFARAEAERESALKYAVETEAPALCRVAVEKQLKAPSSAEFQSEQASV